MKSIIWFKLNQKNPFLYFGGVGLLCVFSLVIYLKMQIPFMNLVAVFPIVAIFFAFICGFSNNLFILSENVFSTSLTIKKIWGATAMFATFVGGIFAEIILIITWFVIGVEAVESTWIYVVFNVVSIFISFVWILISTIHYASFAKGLQYLSSLFSLGYFAFLFAVHSIVKILNFSLINLLLITFIGIVLCLLSIFIINKCSNKEKLVINTGMEFVSELSELELD